MRSSRELTRRILRRTAVRWQSGCTNSNKGQQRPSKQILIKLWNIHSSPVGSANWKLRINNLWHKMQQQFTYLSHLSAVLIDSIVLQSPIEQVVHYCRLCLPLRWNTPFHAHIRFLMLCTNSCCVISLCMPRAYSKQSVTVRLFPLIAQP